MKCQILFSGKNKKNISKCRLLKILPRVLSVKKLPCQKTLTEYLCSCVRVNVKYLGVLSDTFLSRTFLAFSSGLFNLFTQDHITLEMRHATGKRGYTPDVTLYTFLQKSVRD